MSNETITARNIPAFEALASGHRACQGCIEILALRLALKAAGEDVIVANATGCMEVVTTPYPETSWRVPWIHVAFENAAAVGSGVEAARQALLRKGRIADRGTKILVVGGDGGTSDIGLQALSGALERGHDFTYLCLDNEAYMNTGIQRSSATPWGAWSTTTPCGSRTAGKRERKKDLAAIVAAHNIPYVATASPAFHLDLMNKVRRAVSTPGPAFVHLLSPCPDRVADAGAARPQGGAAGGGDERVPALRGGGRPLQAVAEDLRPQAGERVPGAAGAVQAPVHGGGGPHPGGGRPGLGPPGVAGLETLNGRRTGGSMSEAGLEVRPQIHVVRNFRLESGAVLEEMAIEYATLGAPRRDGAGTITNAVVWCHGWSGSCRQGPALYGKAFGPGRPLDPARFFLILPTALGSPGSSCPSVSGLGPDFPKYTIGDMVAAQHLLVSGHLGIRHLAGVAGGSMGGHQTLVWITRYPDFMDWAIPIATGPSTTGRVVGVWGLMSQTIQADPAWQGGRYKAQPVDGLRRAFMGTYLWYFAPAWYQTQFRTPAEVMKGLENAGMGSEKADANDVIWRNEAMIGFNVAAGPAEGQGAHPGGRGEHRRAVPAGRGVHPGGHGHPRRQAVRLRFHPRPHGQRPRDRQGRSRHERISPGRGSGMKYRQLGRTGFEVSEIGFGTWGIGAGWGTVDDATSLAALHRAVDLGVTFFDTADVYGGGKSEQLLARLRRERREPIFIATKIGRKFNPQTPEQYTAPALAAYVEESLKRLATGCLDLLQLHCPPTEAYYRPEIWEALDGLVRQGKLAHYGVSVRNVEEALKAIEYPGVETVQIIFNMFRHRPAELFFPEAQAAGGHHRAGSPGQRAAHRQDASGHRFFERRPPQPSTGRGRPSTGGRPSPGSTTPPAWRRWRSCAARCRRGWPPWPSTPCAGS